jgi:5-methylcytosine-specific restriction endonuclease McrA
MSKKMDLLGKVFGRLIVLEEAGRNKFGRVLWKCLCDCGTIKIVNSNNLRKGDTSSCGCLNVERVSEAIKVDLKGQRFNRLSVLEEAGRDKWYSVLWKCICDCGNSIIVCSSALGSGNTKSCGCLQKERSSKSNKGESNYRYKHGLSGTKEYICNKTQRRKANKLNQTPASANLQLIQAYYDAAATIEGIEVDHIKPLSRGGLHHEDNLQLLDKKLNREKSNKWPLIEEEKIRYKGFRL